MFFGSMPYNYGIYDMVIFNIEKLKEYDPKGVEQFEQLQQQEDEEEIE